MNSTPATLADRLAATASGTWGEEAAVWLLAEHGHWLPELERCGLISDVPLSESRTAAVITPDLAPNRRDLIGTCSEWQVLEIALALYSCDVTTTLYQLTSLDEPNRRLVLHAVAWAAGGREYAESLGLLTPGRAICWRCHHFAAWHVAEIGEPGRACTGSVCGCDDLTTEP